MKSDFLLTNLRIKWVLRLVTNIKHCVRSLEPQHLNNDPWVTVEQFRYHSDEDVFFEEISEVR